MRFISRFLGAIGAGVVVCLILYAIPMKAAGLPLLGIAQNLTGWQVVTIGWSIMCAPLIGFATFAWLVPDRVSDIELLEAEPPPPPKLPFAATAGPCARLPLLDKGFMKE